MPRPKALIPAYRLHKSTGRAVVYVNRQEIYLGKYGSPESREAYSALLDWLGAGMDSITGKPSLSSRSVEYPLNFLFIRFVTDELPRFNDAEQRCIKGAIKIARELFSETNAAEFGPLRLRNVREAMIANG